MMLPSTQNHPLLIPEMQPLVIFYETVSEYSARLVLFFTECIRNPLCNFKLKYPYSKALNVVLQEIDW